MQMNGLAELVTLNDQNTRSLMIFRVVLHNDSIIDTLDQRHNDDRIGRKLANRVCR